MKAHKEPSELRIIDQVRTMDSRGYYFAREGARLRLDVSSETTDGVETWRIGAALRHSVHAEALELSGTGPTRLEALHDVARNSAAVSRELGLLDFDWARIEVLLGEVRAL